MKRLVYLLLLASLAGCNAEDLAGIITPPDSEAPGTEEPIAPETQAVWDQSNWDDATWQ